jgi:hypothetical protein
MSARLLGIAMLSLALAALAVPVTAQTADKKPPKKEKLFAIGLYAGDVLEVDEEARTLKVRVRGKTAVPTFRPGNPTS